MSGPFDRFIGVDWSGAAGSTQSGIAVANLSPGEPPSLVSPSGRGKHWSRSGILAMIEALNSKPGRSLIGIDSSFSLPFMDYQSYLPADYAADHAKALWQVVDQVCSADDHFYGGSWVTKYAEHYRRTSGQLGSRYERRMRVTEQRCIETKAGPCESVFHLIGPCQVGMSGLSTMRMLAKLIEAGDVAVWPFQDCADAKVVIVEIYTGLFAKMGGHRGKIRDAKSLAACLEQLDSAGPKPELDQVDDHKADALITAAGLAKIADQREYWNPPSLSPMVRRTEGWIFGLIA